MRTIIDFAILELRLLWRSWGTRLPALFCLLVILSQHPLADGSMAEYSVEQLAGTWSDRAALLGTILALIVVPFSLHRISRSNTAEVELAKPFRDAAYILGRTAGLSIPLFVVLLASGMIHFAMSAAGRAGINTADLAFEYLRYGLLIVLPPVLFAGSTTFFLSMFVNPVLIVPAYLGYLITTTLSPAAAVAGISWLSPMVRPEYFQSRIPNALLQEVLAHQIATLAAGALLWAAAPRLFRRERFLAARTANMTPGRWFRRGASAWVHVPAAWRRTWGIPVLAAVLWALAAPSGSLDPNPRFDFLAQDSAFLCLEFYLSLSGILLLAGGLGQDGQDKTLDLLLVRPVSRWRLLLERLGPGAAVFLMLAFLMTAYIHVTYTPLPAAKALLVTVATGLYAGMIGATISSLTHHAIAGIGGGFLFWLIEAGFQGQLTAPFFLLITSHQPAVGRAGEFWRSEGLWLPAKLGIFVLAVLLFAANGWLIDRGKARKTALLALSAGLPIVYGLGWWLFPIFLSHLSS